MKNYELSQLTFGTLFNHFYESHDTVLVSRNGVLIGAITYNSFVLSKDSSDLIRNVRIIDSESEMEIGDLVNVYLLRDQNGLREVSKQVDPRYAFTIDRFKDLYKDNDIIANYIKSIKPEMIYVIGENRNYVYNFLNMYGLESSIMNVDDKYLPYLFNNKSPNSIVIDTTGFNTELLKKLNDRQKLELRIFDLKELSKYAEIYNFVNNTSKNDSVRSIVFQFPDISELTNLTEEEKQRIVFDHYYKYYFDAYLKHGKFEDLLRSVFRDDFSREFIESRYTMPKVYNRGGTLFLEDSSNSYCRSFNGMRVTTDQDREFAANINMFGACVVFSALANDDKTLSSYLQRLLNGNGYPYRVNNYGARAIDFAENLRTARNINLHRNDINSFVIMGEEARILREMGYTDICSLTPVFNDPSLRNYFVDEPAHCNFEANKHMACSIYLDMEHVLRRDLTKEECPIISIPNRKDIFSNNKYLISYLKTLEPYRGFDGVTGAIVMNCNPFTYGHYNLINYASQQVDRLIVFVVEEDKSYFKFQDRFKMVQEGCKGFSNVIVVPSGNLLASAMLFPEYFDKEDNPDTTIDVTQDLTLFGSYIAPFLGITKRFVGQENYDKVTHAYNVNLKENLPLYGIEVIEIPRFLDHNGQEISAKVVRKNYDADNWGELGELVPESTVKVLRLIKDRREER